ncbi:GTPase [Ulvibacter antarcticus]|uniref:GTPase n=1 Tax=Ulvibacter antarcticus TaxID=442714 RepID=A0A3L9YHS1_9FLAO|nr:GTPase [Ulvibacter antarcticus]RMA57685.1 hypothetical protein BXY75_2489 [Ulvibacter antarcticus]
MKLLFVYNANSGFINAAMDSMHKIASPETYNCKLCALTFGNFSENKEWKAFRETSDIEMVFLHKDEFLKQYRSKWLPKYDFPVVLSEENGELQVFMTSEVMEGLENISDLIVEINNRHEDWV